MNKQDKIQVKFTGSPENIGQWEADFQQTKGEVSISSRSQEKDPAALNFGLIETAALVTIMTFGFYAVELATRIYIRFQRSKERKDAKANVLIVETPLGKATFISTDDLSREQIKAKLDLLIKVHDG